MATTSSGRPSWQRNSVFRFFASLKLAVVLLAVLIIASIAGTIWESSFDAKVARIRAGPGTMMIHLALDSLPDWRAGPGLQRFAYVHVAPDLAMMSRAFAEAAAGLLPGEPVLVVGQPTAIDPARAPADKHVLWVQVRVLPATIAGDALGRSAARPDCPLSSEQGLENAQNDKG